MKIEPLKDYIEKKKEILELSSLQLEGIENDEDYRLALLRSFEKIKDLAKLNNEILDNYFYPIVNKEDALTLEEIELLREFTSMLVNTTSMESVDIPLIQIQTERVLEEAENSNDIYLKILALDNVVISSYMMLNLTLRLYPEYDYCFKYRDIGLKAAHELIEYLDKDKFINLPNEECKEIIIINSRYVRSLFEWADKEDKEFHNQKDIDIMKQSLAIAYDDFYTKQVPNYPWDIHIFRTLQYLADFTEYHNRHSFNDNQLKEIYAYTKEMIDFLNKHKELDDRCPQIEREFLLLRNGYFAKEIEEEKYKKALLELVDRIDINDFSARNMYLFFNIPFEYILSLDKNNLSEEEMNNTTNIYSNFTSYIYHSPKSGVLSFMLTFLSEILKNYIEVPGGISFEEMCLRLMAVIHPPTFVHTISIANISRFLLKKLFEKKPEYLLGTLGINDINELNKRKDEILDYAHHSALLHDIGKLFITEIIITYGRRLLDEEFLLLRTHPLVGASLIERYPDIAKYSIAAKGHHRYYDNNGGYPESFDMNDPNYKAFLGVLSAADCLDAATDLVGRSYKMGKSLDEYIEELKDGSGARYAPFVVELFNYPDVYEGLKEIINEGRDENYRKTYQILKDL